MQLSQSWHLLRLRRSVRLVAGAGQGRRSALCAGKMKRDPAFNAFAFSAIFQLFAKRLPRPRYRRDRRRPQRKNHSAIVPDQGQRSA